MLTQEDFVAPNMSGEGTLQRSSWKAEAIRRGDLKISGPIPITEDIPLNEEEEREYAEKHKSDSPTLGQDGLVEPEQHPEAPTEAPRCDHDESQQKSTVVDFQPHPPQEQHSESELRHKKSSSGTRETNDMQQRDSTAPVSYSTPSPFPSIPESSTMTTPKKKRKSGLRNVFRKMFGRRSRSENREDEDQSSHKGHSHHASDPGLLRKSSERRPNARGQRISDLPVQEPRPLNPLGQHLPFPMNVNAPQEASPPHEYLTFEVPSPDLGRRRATLPEVLLGNTSTHSLDRQTRHKRLSTWDERPDGESIPSPQIGIALSSPPGAPLSEHSLQSKRRSRSAGALRDLAKAGVGPGVGAGRGSVERRRNAEIRYWRNSYASGSVYSAQTPRPETARTVETVETVRTVDTKDTHDNVAQPTESLAESRTVDVEEPSVAVAQHDMDISQIQLPVEAFNFGNLKSGFSDDEDSEERSVPAPPLEKRLSIEERVKHLEENVQTLETSVRRISGRSNRQTIILENAPKGRRSRNRSSSATSDRQGSHHSSKSSNNTLHGRHEADAPPSPGLPPLSAVNEVPTSDRDRPETMIAIEQPQRTSNLTALHEALRYERDARKALESQVLTLQRDVSDLHALVQKLISVASPSYPTPSPDGIIASNEERLSTPRASTRPKAVKGREISMQERQTVVTTREEPEWSVSSGSREDVTSPEDWATPKEESGFGSGFFGRSRSRDELRREGVLEEDMF